MHWTAGFRPGCILEVFGPPPVMCIVRPLRTRFIMRTIDTDRQQSVRFAQLYLTVREARELRQQLDQFLAAPESSEHFHVHADDTSRELSCSIITPRKLAQGSYTDFERRVFEEK
jgi:hypothetical protein